LLGSAVALDSGPRDLAETSGECERHIAEIFDAGRNAIRLEQEAWSAGGGDLSRVIGSRARGERVRRGSGGRADRLRKVRRGQRIDLLSRWRVLAMLMCETETA